MPTCTFCWTLCQILSRVLYLAVSKFGICLLCACRLALVTTCTLYFFLGGEGGGGDYRLQPN